MRFSLLNLLAVATVLSWMGAARAERESEDRSKAEFVVTGVVNAIYTRETMAYYHYIVEIRVEEVEKGKDLKTGSTLYVYSFDRKKSAPIEPSMSGHDAPPKKGQRIKAFVKDGKGKHEAIYPNWYDEIKAAPSK